MLGRLEREQGFDRVIRSGRMMHLLAADLVEDGFEWTRERAEENVRFFAALRDPKDKEVIWKAVYSMLQHAFAARHAAT